MIFQLAPNNDLRFVSRVFLDKQHISQIEYGNGCQNFYSLQVKLLAAKKNGSYLELSESDYLGWLGNLMNALEKY